VLIVYTGRKYQGRWVLRITTIQNSGLWKFPKTALFPIKKGKKKKKTGSRPPGGRGGAEAVALIGTVR